jgi:hypothetical protein
MTTRYNQMLPLIDQIKPNVIVEVGVHRAKRAVQLCERALRAGSKNLLYEGFDVFETKDAKFQAAAMNGKGMPMKKDAEAALLKLAKRSLGFRWRLHVGDTAETLAKPYAGPVDFAFIDGDHRVEAIERDYNALLHAKVIVFDDYYVPDPDGKMPIDLTKFGCNKLVDELREHYGAIVQILPKADPCNAGGYIKLAVVTR